MGSFIEMEFAMSTPKGLKCVAKTLSTGEKVLIYGDTDHIMLQLRRQVATEENILEPSFKVAVCLSPAEAIAVAGELLNAALPQLSRLTSLSAEAPFIDIASVEAGQER